MKALVFQREGNSIQLANAMPVEHLISSNNRGREAVDWG